LGKVTCPICDEVQQLNLDSKHGITRPYYHGGEYNGKAVIKLMQCAADVMESIRDYIISKVPEDDELKHSEVRDWASKYTDILLVFDQIFSLSLSPTGTLTDEDIINVTEYICTAMKAWQKLGFSVTPKCHALENHLVQQILKVEFCEMLRGIGQFTEDFVEHC